MFLKKVSCFYKVFFKIKKVKTPMFKAIYDNRFFDVMSLVFP